MSHSYPDDPATRYALSVVNEERVAGELMLMACQRHLIDLERAAKGDVLAWDVDAAQRVIDFFPQCLRHHRGDYNDQPFVLNPWQEFVVGSLYGWYLIDEDMRRRYWKAYIETGKGSGKSPIGAGLSIYHVLLDNQAKAQAYFIAANGDQALIPMLDALAMIQKNPELEDHFRLWGGEVKPEMLIRKHEGSRIERRTTPPNARGTSGFSVSFLLVDEYHEHLNAETYELYAAGVKNRRNPLTLIITNAGTDIASPCGQEHEYAISVVRRVIGGEHDAHDAYFSFVCGIDKDDDLFEDESCWPKANPSLPGPPGLPYVREQLREYQKQGKKTLADRLIGCHWVNSEDGWLPPDAWRRCETEKTLEELGVTDETPCYAGFDLSIDRDLSAVSLNFDLSTEDEEAYVGMTKIWTQEDTLDERAHRDNAPYRDWAEAGYLTIIPGHSIKYSIIAEYLAWVNQRYNLQGVAYDKPKSKEVFRCFDDMGIETTKNFNLPGIYCVSHPQGFAPTTWNAEKQDQPGKCYLWMATSMTEVERILFDEHLTFVHNPLMNFAIARTVVTPDTAGTSRKIGKKSPLHTRNDPLVAYTMAAGLTWEMKRLRPDMDIGGKYRAVL